ncbi:MAG TPA: helix-turn-helix domain-containing protein, partial [Caulobacterales bacterium]|nr:helix-turn-helix domain-containing protein [Caulobacterales bacterium]
SEEALLSLRAERSSRYAIELDLVGRESAAGAFAALGDTRSPYTIVVASGGRVISFAVRALESLLRDLPTLHHVLMLEVRRQLDRFAQSAASVSRSVQERLAALLAARFARADEILITHDELSSLLGVRRAGVTVALQELEGQHAIRANRGRIRLIDPEALARNLSWRP